MTEKTYDLKVLVQPLLWPVRVIALGYALALFGVTVSFMGAVVLVERARDFLTALLAGRHSPQRYSGRVSGRRP